MPVYYLKYKLFILKNKKVINFLGSSLLIILILSLAMMGLIKIIGFEKFPLVFQKTVGYSFIISALAILSSIVLYNDNVTDFDKKVLCMKHKTGLKKCDQLIDLIVQIARKRKHVQFKQNDKLINVNLDLNIDEPYVSHIHKTDGTISDMDKSKNKLIIYQCKNYPDVLFFKEYLVSLVKKEEDYLVLEKLVFILAG